jgi:uncharacterized membrane protein YkoI
MKNRKWLLTAGVVLVFGLLLFIGFQWWAPSLSAQTLTKEEANQAAMDKYPGDIIKTTRAEGEYHIEMKLETGVYHIRIDEKSGEVVSIKRQEGPKESRQEKPKETTEEKKRLTQKEIESQISSQGNLESIDFVEEKTSSYYKAVVSKKNEKISLKLDPYTGAIIESTKEPASILTEKEAIAIAEDHLKGTADDVELYQPSNQTPYYLVEVELEDGREATVQVDAYTRLVKTVTWDDVDEDDADDESE